MSYPADALVLRVAYGGGFVPAGLIPTRLPVISVYGDGRVITQGPVIDIYPAPAWPNPQVQQISPTDVDALVDRAVRAGVGGHADYGDPAVADASSTTFTVRTADGLKTTDVYALSEGLDAGGLTKAQLAARQQLLTLLTALTDLSTTLGPGAVPAPVPFDPAAIAAVSQPWTMPDPNAPAQSEVAWPGPPLPGQSLGAGLDLGCVTATGATAGRVVAAAKRANQLTPWRSGAKRWLVMFRPLLPDEHDCADLLAQH